MAWRELIADLSVGEWAGIIGCAIALALVIAALACVPAAL